MLLLQNHMLNFGDIGYVGGARATGVHAECWAWHIEPVPNLHNLVYGYRVGPKVRMIRRITGARLR